MIFTTSVAWYEFWICFKDNNGMIIYDVDHALVIFEWKQEVKAIY